MHNNSDPQAGPAIAPEMYGFPTTHEGLLTWSRTVDRIGASRNYWISTVRPDGRPHSTPVWGVWIGGALYFDGHPGTRWVRNLMANPAISVNLESAEDVVILEGKVEDLVTDEDLGRCIIDAWNAKYGEYAPDPTGSGLLRVRPRHVRAWSTATLVDGTRWTFTT